MSEKSCDCGHSPCPMAELAEARNRIAELDERLEDWKDATGLIDAAGDPGGIEPEHLRRRIEEDEAHIAELKAELAEARKQPTLADLDDLGL